ncbi:MAG TPA: M50 family metallopeptidase [Clostridia bacterium]|nr:M50 family metallopeptidase [Clostridia bacterium]
MKIFRAGGMDIKINPFFLITIGVALITGYWKEAAIIVAVVTLHELSHALAAKALNIEVESIELLPFGAVARLGDETLKPSDEIFSALAGPFSNLISVMLAVSLNKQWPQFFALEPVFVKYSLMLAIFNLLPALPLDGGRVLRALLMNLAGYNRATHIACVMGYILAGVMIITGIYLWLWQKALNIAYFAVAVFIIIAAAKERKTTVFKCAKDNLRKIDRLSKDGALPIRNVAVYYYTPIEKLMQMRMPGVITVFNVVDDRLRFIGSIPESQLVEKALDHASVAADAI